MKRIRKYFNSPSKTEALIIADGCDKLLEMAKRESSEAYAKERKRKHDRDAVCPNCGGTTIVNKIARVEGSGYVSGNFIFGSGSIYGSSTTDTNEVNNCNQCGNQWKKYESTFRASDDILAEWINDLNTVFEGKYDFGQKTVELLKDIPAESIWKEAKRVADRCYYKTRENITLSFLRTKFVSVYDY